MKFILLLKKKYIFDLCFIIYIVDFVYCYLVIFCFGKLEEEFCAIFVFYVYRCFILIIFVGGEFLMMVKSFIGRIDYVQFFFCWVQRFFFFFDICLGFLNFIIYMGFYEFCCVGLRNDSQKIFFLLYDGGGELVYFFFLNKIQEGYGSNVVFEIRQIRFLV